jgi:hypothetical protein
MEIKGLLNAVRFYLQSQKFNPEFTQTLTDLEAEFVFMWNHIHGKITWGDGK